MKQIPKSILDPPEMKGAFGQELGLGLRQRYSYLNSKGIPLHSWSTDECVLKYLKKIQEAIRELEEIALENDSELLKEVISDLHCVMRRTPSNRSR